MKPTTNMYINYQSTHITKLKWLLFYKLINWLIYNEQELADIALFSNNNPKKFGNYVKTETKSRSRV